MTPPTKFALLCRDFDEAEMAKLKDDINDKIIADGYNEYCIISPSVADPGYLKVRGWLNGGGQIAA